MVKGDSSLQMNIRQFIVSGRPLPSESEPEPVIYRMRIFSKDELHAKSRFWYFTKRMNNLKRAHGEILSVREIFEKNTDYVKTYGILMRYDSRTGTHNMYREYRETSLNGAVGKMMCDMAGRHKARLETILIIKTKIVEKKADVRRPACLQFLNSKIHFPLLHELKRPSTRALRSVFLATRPTTRN